MGTGFGFSAGGAVSGIATKATSQMTFQVLQRTTQGAIIGSTAGTAGAFTGNVTDQTWDIVTGEKTTFDTRSLIRDTSMGFVSGLTFGAALGYFEPKFFQTNKIQVTKSNNPGTGETGNDMVNVTRWGRSGLELGDWVMKGKNTWWNYLRSFKWQPGMGNQFAPKSAGELFQVSKDSVKWPTGWGIDGWWKGLYEQRRYMPLSRGDD